MEALYKGILKNYAVQLADVNGAKYRSNDEIYSSIFSTLEEYMNTIFPLKMEEKQNDISSDVMEEYHKFERFQVGKLDKRDILEKELILLGMSRSLFTHSLPLAVAERCYIQILKEIRNLIVDAPNAKKQEENYQFLLNTIEEFNKKLLATKVYWDKPEDREEYKAFWEKYQTILKLKQTNYMEYTKQREIHFIRNDLKQLRKSKKNYANIISFYQKKLVENGAMRKIKNACKTEEGKYIKISK